MLQSKDRSVVAGALVLFVLVPLALFAMLLYYGSLWEVRGGHAPLAATNLQTLEEMFDAATSETARERQTLSVGTRCKVIGTRPCAGFGSLYASRVKILSGGKRGKLMWLCSDHVMPVLGPMP